MYFVRTIKVVGDNIEDYRTPGFYKTCSKAQDCIKNNWGDIFENGFYNYAVIEYIKPGLYEDIIEKNWYWYDTNLEKAVELSGRPRVLGDSQYSINNILPVVIG